MATVNSNIGRCFLQIIVASFFTFVNDFMLLEIFYFHVNIQIPFRFYRKTKNNRFNHAFVDSDGPKSKELKKKKFVMNFFAKMKFLAKFFGK